MPTILQHFLSKRDAFIRKYSFLRKLFVGKNNQIVIIQWPNLPLSLAIILALVAAFVHPPFQIYAHYGYVASIMVWAGIELVTGDSLFRKLLGLGVLVEEIISLLKI